MEKLAFMALIHCTVLEGSSEKSAGRAALSSVALVDIGVVGFTGGAGGTALCLGVLGVWGVGIKGTVVEGSRVVEPVGSSQGMVENVLSVAGPTPR